MLSCLPVSIGTIGIKKITGRDMDLQLERLRDLLEKETDFYTSLVCVLKEESLAIEGASLEQLKESSKKKEDHLQFS